VEFTEVVRRRRMVHAFEPRPVDRTAIDQLLQLARRGPSAGFAQGTDFLVLDDPHAVARFWELTDDPRFPREPGELDVAPPVLALAFADPSRYLARYSEPDKIAFGLDRADAWPVEFWVTDTAMACMLLLLAAVDMGLGGWLFGVNHGVDDVFAEFGVPADRKLIAVIGLGHEAVDQNPRGSALTHPRRPFDQIVHRNHW
jgi:nitroreductase